jgi:hypothetical protein
MTKQEDYNKLRLEGYSPKQAFIKLSENPLQTAIQLYILEKSKNN